MTLFIVMRQENDKKMTRILRRAIQTDLVWLREAILKKYLSEAEERNNYKKWDIGNQ